MATYALTHHAHRSHRFALVLALSLLCWLACALSLAPTVAHSMNASTATKVCHCAHCPGGAACCCRTAAACPSMEAKP